MLACFLILNFNAKQIHFSMLRKDKNFLYKIVSKYVQVIHFLLVD